MALWGRRRRLNRSSTANAHAHGAGGVGILTCGDVEANPVPDDYQVDPRLIPIILHNLGCASPIGDAFSKPHNALFRQPWGENVDAFTRSWRSSLLGPLWLNPPFTKLPEVERKIRTEGAYVILICPGWRAVLPPLMALSTRHFRLPPGPTYRRNGKYLLPEPKWPSYALLINHSPARPASSPPLCRGYIEGTTRRPPYARPFTGRRKLDLAVLSKGHWEGFGQRQLSPHMWRHREQPGPTFGPVLHRLGLGNAEGSGETWTEGVLHTLYGTAT